MKDKEFYNCNYCNKKDNLKDLYKLRGMYYEETLMCDDCMHKYKMKEREYKKIKPFIYNFKENKGNYIVDVKECYFCKFKNKKLIKVFIKDNLEMVVCNICLHGICYG